ncbi:MAG: queuosine precursor transporter [Firmicutes bacterium]|nr:queuosine precursor transporter [Bacillota bacterium]
MTNELILILNVLFTYSMVLLAYRFFGKTGLYCWTVLATIAANIEVLIVVNAFGMEQTLGNILFASTFLVTDILSENVGRKEATRAVKIGILTSLVFVLISQSWLHYIPSGSDWASPAIEAIFANTPRLILSSLGVYAIVQSIDVVLYHAIWKVTTKLSGSRERFLWLRNNLATITAQLLNAFLYNFAAFGGMYEVDTLIRISLASFVIFLFTSLLDTPAVYLSRKIKPAE